MLKFRRSTTPPGPPLLLETSVAKLVFSFSSEVSVFIGHLLCSFKALARLSGNPSVKSGKLIILEVPNASLVNPSPLDSNFGLMMDNQNASPQLLAGLLDPPGHNNHKEPPKKRRLRKCRSAPMADYLPLEEKGIQPIPRIGSVFGNIHPSLRKVVMFLTIYLGVGTICFYIMRFQIQGEKTNGVVDALYFVVVTMTTVGYGDIVPDSVLAKLVSCGFVFAGVALIGLTLSKAADYLVEKQEVLLVRALHVRQKVGSNHIMKEIEINKVKYKIFMILTILLVLMLIGIAVLSFVEKKDFVDALYCVCCTITTLGYGDHSFSTEGGRLFAVFWILLSTICLGQFFFYIAELNTETRQREVVRWVLSRRVTIQDLEAADLDNDGDVEAAEFILYKLKEMGKITQEDIAMVMEEFEELDVDQSGTLSVSDISLAQSDTRGKHN